MATSSTWWYLTKNTSNGRYPSRSGDVVATSEMSYLGRCICTENAADMAFPKKLYPTKKDLPVSRRWIDPFKDIRR